MSLTRKETLECIAVCERYPATYGFRWAVGIPPGYPQEAITAFKNGTISETDL